MSTLRGPGHVSFTPFHSLPPWEAKKAAARSGIRGFGDATPITVYDILMPAYAMVRRTLPTIATTVPLPDHIDTVRGAVLQLQQAEHASLATANAYIRRHNAGRMQSEEYAEYDGLRHSIHDAQVAYHRALREALYNSLGRSAGDQIIARVPYPGWFPRLDTPQVALVNEDSRGLASLGNPAAAVALPPIVIGAIILAVILGVGLLVHEVTKFVDATGDAIIARAQASTLQRIVEQRENSYASCVQAGQPPADCARQSRALTNDLERDLHELMDLTRQRRMKRALGGLAGVLGFAAVVGIGVIVYKSKKKAKAGVSGLKRRARR